LILSQAFGESASRNSGHPAVLDLGRTTSYAQLRENVGRLSNLYQTELLHGARVALLAQNGAAFAQTFLAMSNVGCPVLPIDPRDTDESILTDIRQLGIKAVLVTHDQVSRMRELFRRDHISAELIEIEKRRAGEYDASYRPPPERPFKDTDNILILRQEDGGGGERLYIFFNHKQVLGSCQAVKRFYKLGASDRLLTTMSWSHPFALTHGLLLPLLTGATCAVDPQSPSVEEFVDYLAVQRINRFVGPPKFYFQLLSYCASRKYTLPGVKSITVGMGSISLALRKTYKLLKIPVLRCYGRTEAVWSLAMDDVSEALDVEAARSHPGSGVRFSVLNEDDEEIPGPGRREGRLAVMAEYVGTGFYHPNQSLAERKTDERFRGTWLKTDDVARLEGNEKALDIAVLGKTTDMLLSEGEYLSPRRIDEAAKKLDGVDDAAGFVRIGKDKTAEFAIAVVTKTGKGNERELLLRLEEDLPSEYQPRSVHFVSSLPRDAFDSVNRLALQRQFSLS
jgi:acyl-CoA synthetase (AMP-forming)/AMP-acid ligase II